MAFAAGPDPRGQTAGGRLDAALELHEQSLDALEAQATADRERIAALERAVAVLEALVIGGER